MAFLIFLLLSFTYSSLGVNICPSREITASSGRITSPNYPGKYPGDVDCILTIKLPLDSNITFTLTKLDLEGDDDSACYDTLTIRDITEKEYCRPTAITKYSPVLNIVEVHMKSDGSIEESGFDISYSAVQITGLPTPISVCNTRTVNADTSGGRVMSPLFPNKYGDNINCKLTLKIPPNKKTEVSFGIFDVEFSGNCVNDRLVVTDTKGAVKTVCGTGKVSSKTFSGNEVYINFITTTNTNNKKGFILSYKLIDVLVLPTNVPAVTTKQPPTSDQTTTSNQGCACSQGSWYIKRSIPQNNVIKRQTDDITVQFKTTEKNAMFIYAKGNVRDYIFLKLQDGNIVYEVDVGTGNVSLNAVTANLNDNQWHKVVVQRNEKSVTVTVDDLSQVSGTTPGAFTQLDITGANAALYALGGYGEYDHTFNGCVKNFVVDGMKPIEAMRNNDAEYTMYGGSSMGQC